MTLVPDRRGSLRRGRPPGALRALGIVSVLSALWVTAPAAALAVLASGAGAGAGAGAAQRLPAAGSSFGESSVEEPPAVARRQAQRLMNAGLPFAEKMLAEHGRFFPFGTVMLPDGLIRAVGATEDLEQAPDELYRNMLQALRAGAGDGSFAAAATFANVEMQHPDGRTITAVHVALEHRAGYCVDIYFPVERTGETVGLGESFAALRAGTLFDACKTPASAAR